MIRSIVSYTMADMTWPEAKERVGRAKVAILATGAQEQHGPYLACNTDIAAAYEFARQLAARTQPQTILCPPVSFGISPHHAHFPGTISVSAQSFMGLLFDICESLAGQGISQVFVVNGHGGNQSALGVLMAELRRKLDVRMAYCLWPLLGLKAIKQYTQGLKIGHACILETSMMLHLCPDGVRRDAIVEGEILASSRDDKTHPDIHQFKYYDEITANGAFDGAPKATPEIGRLLTESALDAAERFLISFCEEEAPSSTAVA